jgi:hypothetical protein
MPYNQPDEPENTAEKRRGGAHYIPKPRFRTDDASRHANSLYEALEPWIATAIGGGKRHRICSLHSPSINRAADDILCDCAYVLATAAEWDGALMAHFFAEKGWPVDVELVRLCHTWSSGVMDQVMAAMRNRSSSLRGDR